MSSSALDINPSQPPASTHVDAGMHKEDPQATSGPKSLGITGEERGHPQLSSGMSASLFNKPIFSDSFIIHFESTSGNDALEDSTAEVDPRKSNPHDSIPQQQGIDEGSKRYSLDHIFVGTDPNVLTDQTKSVSEGLETVLTEPVTRKGANTSEPKYEDISFEETKIKLEDLSYLVPNIQVDFMDLNSPEDNPIIFVDDSPQPLSPSELLEKSLHSKFSKMLSTHDFSSSLPTELKELPTNFQDLNEELKGLMKQVHDELEIKLPGHLKAEFLSLPTQVESVQAKLKTLDALPSLLLKVTEALNRFAQVFEYASTKSRDQSFPLTGTTNNMLAEREKNNQTIIS
ncbi:hypothetical protein Tco_0828640 [Tanacetum coccineum]